MPRIFRQEHALFRRGKAAADHKYVHAREKLAVTCGTVGDAVAAELFFAPESHHPGMGTGRQKDAEAGKRPAACLHGFDVPLHGEACDLRRKELRAEGLRLPPHGFR